MWSSDSQRETRALLLVSAALVVWGGVGLWQGLHTGFTGGLYNTEYVVPEVWPGSLTEKAGFKAGDRVVSVEGIAVERLGMESRWPRALQPRVGQTHRFFVERAGAQVAIDLVYPPPFQAAVDNRIAAFILGFAFLACGVWAFVAVPGSAARQLAGIGLASGAATFLELGPGLGHWNGVKGHLATAASLLMYMLLLQFFVTYPRAKAVSANRPLRGLAVGLWLAIIAFLVLEILVHPRLYYTTGSLVAPVTALYGALILVAFGHTLFTMPPAERRASGVLLIAGGFAVALIWIALSIAGVLRLPAWVASLALSAIPVTMALAVRRHPGIKPPPA